MRVGVAELPRPLEQVRLHRLQHLADALRGPGQRHAHLLRLLARQVAPGQHAGSLGQVLRPQLDAHRHAVQLPFVELVARLILLAVVHLDASPARSSSHSRKSRARMSAASLLRRLQHGFVFSSGVLKIGTMTTWIGASRGGSTSPWSSLCVMMRPPISRVDTPQLVAQAYSSLPSWFWNCHVERLGEVLAEEMARARLAAPCCPASSPRCRACRRRRGTSGPRSSDPTSTGIAIHSSAKLR